MRTLLAIAVVALPACVSLSREPPRATRYVLDVDRTAPAVAQPIGRAVEIRQLRATAPHAGRKLVFRDGDHTADTDFYAEFLVPAPDAITSILREWCARSGMFTTAFAGRSVVPDWTIDGEILELWADVRGEPAAVLGLHLTVVDSAANSIVVERTYRVRRAMADGGAAAYVEALDGAVVEALEAFERDLLEAAEAHS